MVSNNGTAPGATFSTVADAGLLDFCFGLDTGSDTRTPVEDKDYQVPFRFNGKMGTVVVKLGPDQLMAEDRKTKQDVKNAANN